MPDKTQSLSEHLTEMQNAAFVALGLLDVISACGDNPTRQDLIMIATGEAQKVLKQLSTGLDSVTLSKMVAA